MAVLRGAKENKVSLKKECFDALKVARKIDKFEATFFEVYEVEKPKIEALNQEIANTSNS